MKLLLLLLPACALAFIATGDGGKDPNVAIVTCSSQLTILPLKRLYNQPLAKDHFHSNDTVIRNWIAMGYKEIETIGSVVGPQLCQQTLQVVCPSVVKLRAFISSDGVEFMTTNNQVAQKVLKNGGLELPPVGYCSSVKACGAIKNMRSVIAQNFQNILYLTNDDSLKFLNRTSPYTGSLQPTTCWLF